MHGAGSVLSAKLARSYSASPTREIRSVSPVGIRKTFGEKGSTASSAAGRGIVYSPLSAGQSLYNLGDCLLLALL
jgi:hypothetical protein